MHYLFDVYITCLKKLESKWSITKVIFLPYLMLNDFLFHWYFGLLSKIWNVSKQSFENVILWYKWGGLRGGEIVTSKRIIIDTNSVYIPIFNPLVQFRGAVELCKDFKIAEFRWRKFGVCVQESWYPKYMFLTLT